MIVISYSNIREYTEKNKVNRIVADALNNWYKVVISCDWSNLDEIKQIFNTVDYVGNDRYVFNVLGNNYRIIAMIHFKVRTVYILFIGTHAAYNKVDAREVRFIKSK